MPVGENDEVEAMIAESDEVDKSKIKFVTKDGIGIAARQVNGVAIQAEPISSSFCQALKLY